MNYLICDICNFKNVIYTERVAFCNHCHQKMKNNYIDWKKSNNNASFETYITEATTTDSTPLILKNTEKSKDKNRPLKNPIRFIKIRTTKKARVFIVATLAQFLLFSMILFTQKNNLETTDEATVSEKNYLPQVKWGNYSISQEIAITLPFELKKSESVLPCYMTNYYALQNSRKAESSESFSVTIEEFDINDYSYIATKNFLEMKDAYMLAPDAYFTANEGYNHLKIKNYQTDMQHGSYIANGKNYYYDNYTLTKGNKAVKIIVSYLQNDELLSNYANIVSQSIFNNKQQI
jgi:hypothetical protein